MKGLNPVQAGSKRICAEPLRIGTRRKGCATKLMAAVLAGLLPVASQADARDTGTTVLATDARAATELERRGAALIANRTGYRVYRMPSSMTRTSALPAGAIAREDFDFVSLRRRSIDTTQAIASPNRSSSDRRRLRLVQFSAPPTDADRDAIEATGATVVHYIAQNAYLVWTEDPASGQSLTQLVAKHAGARWEGSFEVDDAISPHLDARRRSGDSIDLTVQIFAGARRSKRDLSTAVGLAERSLHPVETSPDGRYLNLRLRVAGDRIAELAALSSVVNIEPWVAPTPSGERQGQTLASNLDGSGQAPVAPGYLAFLSARGFSTDPADYPVVAVVDDGVDDGTTTPQTDEFYEFGDPGGTSRLVFSVLPPGSAASGPQGPDGHGHINTSILGGFSDASGPSDEDAEGYNYGLGISPYGRLANVRIFDPGHDVGFGTTTMVDDYYARGARISSNSWGADTSGAYTVDSQTYDALTRDARPTAAGNQEMLFVFSAGNAGPGAGSIGSPASAKNVLAVGAGESANPDAVEGDGCLLAGSDGDDVRDVAVFSSRGPAGDGRVRPDVTAPGTFVQGNATQPLATFTGSLVCGAVTNDFVVPGSDALFPPGTVWTWSSGTSHAAPAVSGAASLATEYLQRVHGLTDPSPALLKAFLVHTATYQAGSGAGEDLPGNNQGFGRLNLELAFDPNAARTFVDQSTVFGAPGETAAVLGHVIDPSKPVRVALVWTDAPGATVGNAYINDLDLTVEVDGTSYLGNRLAGGVSQTGGFPDTKNNTEVVFLPPTTTGPITITVRATSVAGDGVPGNADVSDQDFALVAYNVSPATSAGALALSDSAYGCDDEIEIALADFDLAGDGQATVSVTTTTGDAETVTLAETPADSGFFAGTIATATGSVSVEDGTVQGADTATLTATYQDADDGAGSPATVEDTAVFDCSSPTISMPEVSVVTATSATVAFDASETSVGRVRFGTTCSALARTATSEAASTSHNVSLFDLDADTTYFFVAEATDTAGNVGTDDNAGSCYTFTTQAIAQYFAEQVTVGGDPLSASSILFTPNGGADFYEACRRSVGAFHSDPTGSTALVLGDDSSVAVALTGGKRVSLYGTEYDTIFVGSNGYVTLGAGDTDAFPSFTDHFSFPRIAPLYTDLDPGAGGEVSVRQDADRMVVTWIDVPRFGSFTQDLQVEMYFDGAIRITRLSEHADSGLVGLSRGAGLPPDFVETDFTTFGSCPVAAACPTAPRVNCRAAEKSKLAVREKSSAEKNRIGWKWTRGEATDLADFGDPTVSTDLALCVYDRTTDAPALVVESGIGAGPLLWSGSDSGFKYKDKSGFAGGATRIQLRAGADGNAKIQFKGEGLALPLPGPVAEDRYFDVDPDVTVQLIGSDTPACWSSTFSSQGTKKNKADSFKAKAP